MEETREGLGRILEGGSLGGLHSRLVMGVVLMEDQKEEVREEYSAFVVVEGERFGNCRLEGIQEVLQEGDLRLVVWLEDRSTCLRDLLV